MIAVTLIAVYLVSAYGTYKFVQMVRCPNGVWQSDAKLSDVIMTLLPAFNTLACIAWFIAEAYFRIEHLNFNRFFNIKTTNNDTRTKNAAKL